MDSSEPLPSPSTHDLASLHLRRAMTGDLQSLEWLVLRLSPLLRMQAAYRLGTGLRAICDPEDLVQEAWIVALPRLSELRAIDGRYTPALLRFLSAILLYRSIHLSRKNLRNEAPEGTLPPRGVQEPSAEQTGVISAIVRAERQQLVARALEELDPADREILVLRGIEQQRNQTVCELLGLSPQAVSMRFHRALGRLRERLPGSAFDEVAEPD